MRAGIGGLITVAAYLFVLIAYRYAPLTAVAPLRESAIVLISGWGSFRLKEATSRRDAGTPDRAGRDRRDRRRPARRRGLSGSTRRTGPPPLAEVAAQVEDELGRPAAGGLVHEPECSRSR